MRRLRHQSGQASAEYLGVLIACAALVLALILFAPGLSDQIAGGIRKAVCAVTGDKCEPTAKQAVEPCKRATHNRFLDLSVTAFSGTLGGGVQYTREKLSDGTVRITLAGKGDGGLDEILGAHASGGFGSVKVGEGAGGGATLTAQGEAGLVFTFPNDDAANAFSQGLKDKIRDTAIDTAATPLGALIWEHTGGSDYHFPSPSEEYVQLGVNGSIRGEENAGAAGVSGEFKGAVALGGSYDNKTHEKTIYLKLSGDGGAEASALFGLGANGKADLNASLVLDAQGHPKLLKLEGAAEGTVDPQVLAELEGKGDLGSLSKALKSVSVTGKDGTGKRVELEAALPLDDAQNREAVLSFLHGTNPLTGSPVDAVRSARTLYDRFAATGAAGVRTYDVNGDGVGVEAKAGAPPFETFGGKFDLGTQETALTGAYVWEPGRGLVADTVCTG